MTIKMVADRITKNKIRFQEIPNGTAPQVIETIYVPKSTLRDIGWTDSKQLIITIEAEV